LLTHVPTSLLGLFNHFAEVLPKAVSEQFLQVSRAPALGFLDFADCLFIAVKKSDIIFILSFVYFFVYSADL